MIVLVGIHELAGLFHRSKNAYSASTSLRLVRTATGERGSARRYEDQFRNRHALRYQMPWTKFRDEILPISRSVFDIGWKVEIVGNVGSIGGYLGENRLFGLQRDKMGTSRC